jgi:cellobiose phosphorylase
VSNQGYADSFSNDATAFLGHGSVEHPENLAHLDNALKVKGASFFALGKAFVVGPQQNFLSASLTGMVEEENLTSDGAEKALREKLGALLNAFPSVTSLQKQLQKQDKAFAEYASYFQIHSGKEETDAMMNHNIPFQTLYQSFVSRAFAQTQKGYREIGFREVQDLYASIPYLVSSHRQALAAELLSKWIENVYTMGYANHNFFVVGKEPGMCSDDQLWLIPAVEQYIKSTGDIAFLDQEFSTADGGRRSLVDTLKAIITYSAKISVGKHGLPLLDKADWNDCLKIDTDCLDGPTKEKLYAEQRAKKHQEYGVPFESELSESVMNAFLLVYALEKAIELAKWGKKDSLLALAESCRESMVDAIRRNCFIQGYYARVLINRSSPKNGIRYVGAPGDGLSSVKSLQNGSLYLNSFSWSLLSNVANEGEIASMLKLADTYLKTPSGYKLCSEEDLTLTGAKEAATSHYFPGDRENGGVFKHATMMFTRALLLAAKRPYSESLRQAMVEDAYFMLHLAYPYHCHENPYVYKGNPRFCTQYNNPITQENFGPILSGTATWLTLSLWEAMGFSFTPEGLTLQPILALEDTAVSYHLVHQGVTYEVSLVKPRGSSGFKIRKISFDGVEKDPAKPLPILQKPSIHHIDVVLD